MFPRRHGLCFDSGRILFAFFHAAILTVAAKLAGADVFVAVASQANIGGVASAPVVAEDINPGWRRWGCFGDLREYRGDLFGHCRGQLCRLVSGGPL